MTLHTPVPPQTSQTRQLEAAKKHHQTGDLKQALALYKALLATDPNHVDALYFSGLAHIGLQEFALAVDHFNRALRGMPNHPLLMHNLGVALFGMERMDEALQHFTEAVRLNPNNADAHCFLGRIFLKQAREYEAAQILEKAIRLNPEDVPTNALFSTALRALRLLPLANYHQTMAYHFAQKTMDPEASPLQHTFFLDREKAWQMAHQGNLIQETIQTSGVQMCYHFGAPFPKAPLNLISVNPDPDAFAAFFLDTKLSAPTLIAFDPNDTEARQQANSIAKNLNNIRITLANRVPTLKEQTQSLKPIFMPDQPLRVYLPASRKTNVMMYNARDLAKAFRKRGCDVLYQVEANDRESLERHHYLEAQRAFNPHIVVNINNYYDLQLPPEVFHVTYWQDPMPSIMAGKPLPWRKRDLIYSISKEFDAPLYRCNAPHVHRQGFCYDEEVFFETNQERKRKIVLVASAHDFVFYKFPNCEPLIATLTAMFTAGEPITEAALARFAKQSGFSREDIFYFMWGYVVRNQSVHWLCALADEIEVEIYGYRWENDAVVRPFHKGVLPHGPAVASLYNQSLYTLAPQTFDLHSQRLAETVACGCIPIIYDCRAQADEPHWDDHCLWYRTREDLRTCLTRRPHKPVHAMCRGRSYSDFAKRILAEVNAHLSGNPLPSRPQDFAR